MKLWGRTVYERTQRVVVTASTVEVDSTLDVNLLIFKVHHTSHSSKRINPKRPSDPESMSGTLL